MKRVKVAVVGLGFRGITESCGWKCDEGGVSLRF
jgi:hypothetical protein